MKPAVFLDRDGVINQLVFNSETAEYEAPHCEKDFALLPGVLTALKQLQDAGFLLVLVSNQPDYAKGKTSLERVRNIHALLHNALTEAGIHFAAYKYCYHHPDGIIPEYTGPCRCRKPQPQLVLDAVQEFNIDTARSWFVGDQDTDIACGKAAGLRTISIREERSSDKRGACESDMQVDNLSKAVHIIKAHVNQCTQ